MRKFKYILFGLVIAGLCYGASAQAAWLPSWITNWFGSRFGGMELWRPDSGDLRPVTDWGLKVPHLVGGAGVCASIDANGVFATTSCGGGGGYWDLSGTGIFPTSTSYKVGIGTTTPEHLFEVATGSVSYFYVEGDGTVAIGNPQNWTAADSALAIRSQGAGTRIIEVDSLADGQDLFSVVENSDGDADLYLYNQNGSVEIALRVDNDTYFNSDAVAIGTSAAVGTSKLTVANGYAHIGSSGTVNYPSANGDLYVQDALEVDGTTYLVDLNASGALSITGTSTHATATIAYLNAYSKIVFDNYTSCTALETDANGELVCGTDDTGGGGGSGAWTTSSSKLYPVDTTETVIVGGSSTTTAGSIFESLGTSIFDLVEMYRATSSDITATGTLQAQATTSLEDNVFMQDDKILFFDTAKNNYVKYSTAHGRVVWGVSDIATIGTLQIAANTAADGLGTWEPALNIYDTGIVGIENTTQGTDTNRYLNVLMDGGMKVSTASTSDTFVIDLTGNLTVIATSTFATTVITQLEANELDLNNLVVAQATTTNLTVSGYSLFGNINEGTWQGTAITDDYIDNNISVILGQIDNTAIGASNASTSVFSNSTSTNLAVSGYSLFGNVNELTVNGGWTWSSNQDINNVNFTNVDIDSGAIDGTAIGAGSASTGVFSNATSTNLDITTLLHSAGTLSVEGTSTFSTTSITAIVNMKSCTALETDANGSIVCGSDDGGTSGSDNQVLTDDGAGGITSEANFTFDGTNLLTVGSDDTATGTIYLYGDNAGSGGRLRLYNGADDDGTEEWWILEAGVASDTSIDLGVDGSRSLFKFYNSGNLTATGNIGGNSYASDGSVSDTELKYINSLTSNAQDQIDAKPDNANVTSTNMTSDDYGFFSCDGSDAGCSVDAGALTGSYTFYLDGATTSDTTYVGGLRKLHFTASTITQVSCEGTATATIALYERTFDQVRSNATGTAILSSNISCGYASTTSFNDASIAANAYVVPYVDTTSGTPADTTLHIKYTY